ncbi:MAG: phosphoglucomutase/phosphomannomutase PgmG [Sphingobium sp.]
MRHRFDPHILREYDIRGVVGPALGSADAYALGRGFGTHVARGGGSRVVVGRDGRLSSPMLEAALVDGLVDSGMTVLRIGVGPTPMLYYAEAVLDVDGGIQVTGSHNPGDQNGFKLVYRHRPFFGDDITALAAGAEQGDWKKGVGSVTDIAILDAYVDRLVQDFDGAPWRIGWDAGNGAAGAVVEKLTQRLPGEHHLLFTDIDGNFPNHHPDPTNDANLRDLQRLVADKRLDFGLAFDGDGDRLGAVDAQGRILRGDDLLSLFARAVLADHPAARIVADIKTSQALFDLVADLGGEPMMWKTGHSHIKSRMEQVGALLGGEMTGHICFADRYYGYDDALYAAVRLIGALERLKTDLATFRDSMPPWPSTPELRFAGGSRAPSDIVNAVRKSLEAQGAQIISIDGVRVSTADGWWLLRASNTQALLTARAESRDEDGLRRLLADLDAALRTQGVIRTD